MQKFKVNVQNGKEFKKKSRRRDEKKEAMIAAKQKENRRQAIDARKHTHTQNCHVNMRGGAVDDAEKITVLTVRSYF